MAKLCWCSIVTFLGRVLEWVLLSEVQKKKSLKHYDITPIPTISNCSNSSSCRSKSQSNSSSISSTSKSTPTSPPPAPSLSSSLKPNISMARSADIRWGGRSGGRSMIRGRRHRGHTLDVSNHRRIHAAWNECPHTSTLLLLRSIESRQMEHSPPSALVESFESSSSTTTHTSLRFSEPPGDVVSRGDTEARWRCAGHRPLESRRLHRTP